VGGKPRAGVVVVNLDQGDLAVLGDGLVRVAVVTAAGDLKVSKERSEDVEAHEVAFLP